MTAQLALDMSEPLPEWTGSPLGYHEQYATPAEHAAALDRWIEEHGRLGFIARSRMWHPTSYSGGVEGDAHSCCILTAECRALRHEGIPRDLPPHVPDAYMHQANCQPCRWHFIDPSERVVVEAWHDHAFPGWRDLKVMPLEVQPEPGKKALAWIAEHYGDRPAGHPLRTERKQPIATRHVAGRSPWGGFDLGYHRDKDTDR